MARKDDKKELEAWQNRAGELNDLREILQLRSGAGKRFLYRLLEQTRVFESIFESSSRIYYNAGQQDVGHFLLFEINEAEPHAFIDMMRDSHRRALEVAVEAKKRQAQEEQSHDH